MIRRPFFPLGLALATAVAAGAAAAQPAAQPAARVDRFEGDVAAAEALARRGAHSDAAQRARRVTAAYAQQGARNSSEYNSAGRAYVLLGTGNAGAVRSALSAFDRAVKADSSNFDAQRRIGALFLDKYNAPEARASYEAVLKRAPNDVDALLGLAQVEEFEGKGTALVTARRALAIAPQHAGVLAYVARLHLDAETFDSARSTAQRAIAADSSSIDAWSVLGAHAWLSGDSTAYRRALQAVTGLQPQPSAFFTALAEAAGRQRRYAESVQLAQLAVRYDSSSFKALGVLGTYPIARGANDRRASCGGTEPSALDPFNLWHKNTLDLLDKMRKLSHGLARSLSKSSRLSTMPNCWRCTSSRCSSGRTIRCRCATRIAHRHRSASSSSGNTPTSRYGPWGWWGWALWG
ncbi:tetratricopeptide repeat protein [Gemmatimonas sp.]|uniref:tetratricopeptide repeat protein n=1 Tax=Gemmatimonas sp. TaxID=1962908 RepID=UPI003DA51904